MQRDYPKMVGWYSPTLLLKAGVEVLVSSVFGRHADQRTVQALAGDALISDYSSGARHDIPIQSQTRLSLDNDQEAPEIWFDYIADTGDGWDSTYSVAYLATRQELTLKHPGEDEPEDHAKSETLQRGQILLFGGDEVYPSASREAYDRRFLAPFEAAFNDGKTRESTDVYAIPGNHDWYDSLRSFGRIFFTDSPFVESKKSPTSTPQSRSYFAIRLPGSWWLLATDVQLGSDIDANQLQYFRAVAETFGKDDKVILCTAEPHWVTAKKAEKRHFNSSPTALDLLEQEVLGNRVRLFIAGDIHHYMRFESEDDPEAKSHKITAGGGGAFLHPTHRSWDKEITSQQIIPDHLPKRFVRPKGAVFPSPKRSMALSCRNVLFALINPRFGMLTALLYVVFALMMMPAFMRHEDNRKDKLVEQREVLLETFQKEIPALQKKSLRLEESTEDPLIMTQSEEYRKSQLEAVTPEETTSAPYLALEATHQKLIHLDQQIAQEGYVAKMSYAFQRRPVSFQKSSEDKPIDQEDHGNLEAQPQTTNNQSIPNESATTAPEASDKIPYFEWVFGYLTTLTLQELAVPAPFQSMLAMIVFVGVIAGFVAFTDLPNPFARFLLGAVHGAIHWFAAFLITLHAGPLLGGAAAWVTGISALCGLIITIAYAHSADRPGKNLFQRALVPGLAFSILVLLLWWLSADDQLTNSAVILVVFLGGWVAGSVIMGIYLFLSHTLCGQHWNHAFSSIKCADWKCFLRFRLSQDGSLTVYPIGISEACKKWKVDGNHVAPEKDNELQAHLIERPIVLK